MKRFMSWRTSSQQELQPLDDVRAQRAATSLSVGLRWPPARHPRLPGRPTFQEAWERALQHILQQSRTPAQCMSQPPRLVASWSASRETAPHTHQVTSENGWATSSILELAAASDDVMNPGRRRRTIQSETHSSTTLARSVIHGAHSTPL